ncbi:hypothetical protein DFQ26_007855, partial [Actinomortierella ambigua]
MNIDKYWTRTQKEMNPSEIISKSYTKYIQDAKGAELCILDWALGRCQSAKDA